MGAKLAVTGASGQVGTLLRERLAERGVEAIPLNRDDDWAAGIAAAAAVAAQFGFEPGRIAEVWGGA